MSYSSNREASELQDYDIMELICEGSRSTVHLVNCNRGRLRNRQLALKKVSNDAKEHTPSAASAPLHLSLYHPSLVSLFSTFSTPDALFFVLELCAAGSLEKYLQRGPLSEDELRGVVKSLADGLVYLHKQGIVHRNISPSKILLTSEGRVKLSGFQFACRSPPGQDNQDKRIKIPYFTAPEILSNMPYSCEVDVWSLGCVVLTCMTCQLPFKGISHASSVDLVLQGSYDLPRTASPAIRDLLNETLQTNPRRRIHISDLILHSFLDIELPVKLLRFLATANSLISKHALFETSAANKPPAISVGKQPPPQPRHFSGPTKLSDGAKFLHKGTGISRRIVSDPHPTISRGQQKYPAWLSAKVPLEESNQPQPEVKRNLAETGDSLPVGTTRPKPFTTALMSTESHKTVQGTLTVLASRSLLVDLRVGERRRGQKGVEVMLVDPNGTRIEIYAAPHLSAPCCLAEPSRKHTLETLPTCYWKTYNDAAILVQRIKQRTSRLTLHTDAAKCVLMANDPQADIELLLPATGPPKLRMRVSRQDASAEIATHRISEDGGEEWTKKVLKIPDVNASPCILPAEREALGANEQAAVDELERFLSLCRFLESPAAPPPTSSCTASSFSQIHISRRPPKFATSVECDLASVEGVHSSVTWCEEASSETRFLAGVGWCLRQKSKYKIMFFDGAVLEVDVDQECAKLTVAGQTTKHTLRRLGPIADRIKVFADFVDMYDTSADQVGYV